MGERYAAEAHLPNKLAAQARMHTLAANLRHGVVKIT
jgi:hypothetical protein